jgi:Protein of unknown function (DUF4197)
MHRRTFLLALTTIAASSMPAHAKDSLFKRLFGGLKKQALPSTNNLVNHAPGGLSLLDAERGLREALSIGIDAVVKQLGAPGGFYNDGRIQIPLPKTLRKARKLAKPLGMAGPFDTLKERMNRGAEEAMPAAKGLLKNAVTTMSVEDAIGIVRGPDDSATQYLRTRMTPSLTETFTPVIHTTLDSSGALSAGKALADKYSLGSYADTASDKLTAHVVKGALKGSFYYLAEQERAIRANPGNFASELLKRVFG